MRLSWRRRQKTDSAPSWNARVPDGVRVYAVGDLHGRADLLVKLLGEIRNDTLQFGQGKDCRVIFLGDYIDRGFSSRDVLEILSGPEMEDFNSTHLMGNHEGLLLRFLEDAAAGRAWLALGGDATALSYGVHVPLGGNSMDKLAEVKRELLEKLPGRHLEFLNSLRPCCEVGDYFFVHAGIKPDVPLREQDPQDLMTIRDDFLQWRGGFEKTIVHGHSLSSEPQMNAFRIGIDTGAYATGVLTCVVLEGADRSFIQVRPGGR